MEEYLVFMAKALTFAIIFGLFAVAAKSQKSKKPSITLIDAGDLIDGYGYHFPERGDSKAVYVLNFNGGIGASEVKYLRNEITAVLQDAKKGDEVIVRMHSGGGTVTGYGLGAAQMQRVRDAGIPLTVTIDEVAASGGYLMACVANKIITAPFATIGSVGVVVEMPNFNRTLKALGVDYETLTAGESKRTITMFGENTNQAKDKVSDELAEIHEMFKDHILKYRPNIDIRKIATGECWNGARAVELGLCDEVGLIDDYVINKINSGYDVLNVTIPKAKPKGIIKRIKSLTAAAGTISKLLK